MCFPHGSITLTTGSGKTLNGYVDSMGKITINGYKSDFDYSDGSGPALYGSIDSLGNFKASNDYTTVSGSVDTSCPKATTDSMVVSQCITPHVNGCTRESDYQMLQTASNLYGIVPGGGSLDQCRKQIDDYVQATAQWNQCMKDIYGYDTQTQTWGATLSEIKNKKIQTDAVTTKQQACFAKNAQYLESNGSCLCRTGYSFDKDGYCTQIPSLGSCQEQHGIHAVTEGSNCSCPLVGYSFDSNGQCVSDVPENNTPATNINISLETSDITKVAGEVFQTYYPNSVDVLNKGVAKYTSGQKDDAMKSFSDVQSVFRVAKKSALDLNNKYKDKKINEQATNILYSLKEASIICDLTVTTMMSGDIQGVGVSDEIKKCIGWSDYTNNLIGTSTLLSIKNNISSLNSTINVSNTKFPRVLKKGMFGDDVKQLQILLQKLNYLPSTQVPSTYFGVITSNALIKFQKDNKIQPASGSFGPVTQAKLISLTK